MISSRLDEFLYAVEEGETLVAVAYKFSVPVEKLIKDNDLKEEVVAGQTLLIGKP